MRRYRTTALLAALVTAAGCNVQGQESPPVDVSLSALANGETAGDELARRETLQDGFHCGETFVTFTGAQIFVGDEPSRSEPYNRTVTFRRNAIRQGSVSDPGSPTRTPDGPSVEGSLTIEDYAGRFLTYGVNVYEYRRIVLCVN